MALLIADSGSTKCDWVFKNDNQLTKFSTIGLNPLLSSEDEIQSVLNACEEIQSIKNLPINIYFYGAACSSEQLKGIVKSALAKEFTMANIQVDHDLKAAVFATCGVDQGFTAILGTGSNLCFFNGEQIIQKIPSLGYVLGDEGGGVYLGKKLVQAYFYETLPRHLAQEFENDYKLNLDELIQNVYSEIRPNAYLASYVPFLVKHKTDSYVRKLVYSAFASFLSIHLWSFDTFRDYPVHFIGSIAYYFQDLLQEVAINHRFTVGKIIKKPMDNLLEFHLMNS
ncbi:MAG: N-acetylglucosamine kinase [Bacteroidia bacterium]